MQTHDLNKDQGKEIPLASDRVLVTWFSTAISGAGKSLPEPPRLD